MRGTLSDSSLPIGGSGRFLSCLPFIQTGMRFASLIAGCDLSVYCHNPESVGTARRESDS